jgi:3' exoribonuclease, RNase T-like
MIIAAIDIETLDTASTAHVFEIAVVTAEIDQGLFAELDCAKLAPSYMEQLLLGRSVSKSTLDFHIRNRGIDNFENNLVDRYRDSGDDQEYDRVKVKDGLDQIRSLCKDVEEVWINGVSFDSLVLQSLQHAVGDTLPLWTFRKERDVRTVRNTNPALYALTANKNVAHRAYEDALWNLSVAALYHQHMSVLQSALAVSVKAKSSRKKS